jgi:hypothetical protein
MHTILCKAPGCARPFKVRELCSAHYKQMRNGHEFSPIGAPKTYPRKGPSKRSGTKPCLVRGCDRLDKVKGYCGPHYQIARSYGVTPEQIARVLNKEVGCDLCGSTNRLVFDHDHKCCPDPGKNSKGKTCGNCARGILCTVCNTTLGLVRDDTELLQRMIAYVTAA